MNKKMFCYQCEQTVGCTGCTGNAGVCGKKADTAKLQDELTGALIGLARAVGGAETISQSTGQVIIEGLFTTVTNVNFDNASIENMIQKVRAEKERLVPDCSKCQSSCGKTDEYDMQQLWNANEDIRSLKSLILFGIRGMAAYAYHARALGKTDPAPATAPTVKPAAATAQNGRRSLYPSLYTPADAISSGSIPIKQGK